MCKPLQSLYLWNIYVVPHGLSQVDNNEFSCLLFLPVFVFVVAIASAAVGRLDLLGERGRRRLEVLDLAAREEQRSLKCRFRKILDTVLSTNINTYTNLVTEYLQYGDKMKIC